ncbi:GspE/PulE family protein [Gloeocapsa sp. PCC 73106]|uniref:GspE/PulE family protein n=1 Tax=Gloeocapsa sp. PCC 73106 TaxID=102232 RepID=UPI0002ACA011|nr:GspE/PulE family protein [Gloeocapsa sp. PCC 73106]ELR99764.1 type II secretory pathway, ATPase PulE/Tfp pilus assembly pathway, ATPase PilB [Gloeocapsa sp. PCC 73106]
MNKSSLHNKSSRALVPRDFFFPFGNKLIQAGYVQSEQLKLALKKKEESGSSLIGILEELTNRKLPSELIRQYKKHYLFELKVFYGVDCVDPDIDAIASIQMALLIESLIPIEICRRYKLLPIKKEAQRLLVAMVNPDDLEAYDELRRILSQKHLTLQRMVITKEDYQKLLDDYQQEESKRDKVRAEELKQKALERLSDVTEIIDSIDIVQEDVDEHADVITDEDDNNSPPIIALVNKVLVKALKDGASDIHIEPQEDDLRIRFRKDGVLTQAFPALPKFIVTPVVARFKIMADLDIAERRMPQDGRIRRVYQGKKVDFRVNSLPSRYGEKVVLRILDNSSTQLGLDKLITSPQSLATVRELASRPFGLILVTGPTGSGKSTTLYSILAERNDPGVNISTAEDPIEYSLPGITQVQVIREKGMDFALILRAFLRQDPDVILVGETRDKETAKTAIEAALTGHLVLTTLHTNDAAGAIARLDEMGVEPFMVSGALLGVFAQRLMRRVCTECRIAYHPSREELARFGLSAMKDKQITLYKAYSLTLEQIQAAKLNKTLCGKCSGIGYKGRVGVYEIMKITETLQTMINKGATTDRIKEVAVDEGMVTLLAYSLNLVMEGYTTLEEVERVTFTDSGLEAELKAKRKSSLACKQCGAGLEPEWIDCPYCMTPRFQD